MVFIDQLSERQKYGYEWEEKLTQKLASFGHVQHLSQICWTHEFDIALNDGVSERCKLIHCKASKAKKHHVHGKYYRMRYQFRFEMVGSGDFIICICDKYGEPVYFIIPVAELTKRSLAITSHPLLYNGWAAKYRENWNLLIQGEN